jgi:hypothetical protein
MSSLDDHEMQQEIKVPKEASLFPRKLEFENKRP